MSTSKAEIVLTAVPDGKTAEKIAYLLVDNLRIVRCVNIVPQIRSMYRWQGKVCQEKEILLLIKSSKANREKIIAAVKAVHPYDLPEIITIPVTGGESLYLDWLTEV
ncbi:MAG: divalent-cation tolerance protein CutA [Fidelibacterota bacterium]